MKTLLAAIAATLTLAACGDDADTGRARGSLDALEDERLDLWVRHCGCYPVWNTAQACMAREMNFGCMFDSVTTEWLRERADCACDDGACLDAAYASLTESAELAALRDACRGRCDDDQLQCDSDAWRGLDAATYEKMTACLQTANTCMDAQICTTPCLE